MSERAVVWSSRQIKAPSNASSCERIIYLLQRAANSRWAAANSRNDAVAKLLTELAARFDEEAARIADHTEARHCA